MRPTPTAGAAAVGSRCCAAGMCQYECSAAPPACPTGSWAQQSSSSSVSGVEAAAEVAAAGLVVQTASSAAAVVGVSANSTSATAQLGIVVDVPAALRMT
jgi:hypothetical protein